MKFRRKADEYGWTDHAYHRRRDWVIGIKKIAHPLQHRFRRRNRRTISLYNEMLFHKKEPDLLF